VLRELLTGKCTNKEHAGKVAAQDYFGTIVNNKN
jgi:hypothetical protein